MPNEPRWHRTAEHLTFKLPGGQTLALDTLEVSLGTLIDLAQGVLHDEEITLEYFGRAKRFFFVNCSTGTWLDNLGLASFALGSLGCEFGQEIELRFTSANEDQQF